MSWAHTNPSEPSGDSWRWPWPSQRPNSGVAQRYLLVSQGHLRATRQPFLRRCSQYKQRKISHSCERKVPEFWWHICEESQDKLGGDARKIRSWDKDVAALLKDPFQEHGACVDIWRCGHSLLHGQVVYSIASVILYLQPQSSKGIDWRRDYQETAGRTFLA